MKRGNNQGLWNVSNITERSGGTQFFDNGVSRPVSTDLPRNLKDVPSKNGRRKMRETQFFDNGVSRPVSTDLLRNLKDVPSKDGRRNMPFSSVLLDHHATDIGNSFRSRHLLNEASNTSIKNTTNPSETISLSLIERTCFTVGYVFFFLVGCTGDILILIIIKKTKELQSDFNYLLCNIAIADILRMLTMFSYELFMILAIGNPVDAIPAFPGIPGDILCKAMFSLPHTFSYAFVFTLVCITAERFVAVLFPFRIVILKGKSKWLITGVWVSSILLALPLMYASESTPRGTGFICDIDFMPFCSDTLSAQMSFYKNVLLADVILAYVVPILLILCFHAAMTYTIWKRPGNVFTTQRSSPSSPAKRGVVPMLATVSVVFMLTWLPNKVYLFLYIFQKRWMNDLPVYFTFLLFFIAALNSVVNPWLYPLHVKRFRREYAKYAKLVARTCQTKSDIRAHQKPIQPSKSQSCAKETVV